ncbi:protoporphyrinogen/coproporphyrinogen oxidase [Pedobacter sandarakinus]|uniref:protoporphyrinogen/coproporphyrinogen oxidase n=1 Tax=Pedobacter sandarakinus TaxID=353156 RepID=UPI00224512BF|nr:NAD(P)-binding protein [Pedobacter sandarakinus]MCX2574014.1 FAD-dependent oxidoreductase [Pedobacter sandarakinus]
MENIQKVENLILGAGLAGLSVSYHLGHDKCVIFEKKNHSGGHIHSEILNGFTWDEGPHLSFTKHQYVKDLFFKSIAGEVEEFTGVPTNYYKGSWIPHPAQSNLYALPEEIKNECLEDFLNTRAAIDKEHKPENYQEWIEMAFGKTFANTFPKIYTEKYWTVSPELLSTEWVGERVYYPEVEIVKQGAVAPLAKSTHYMTTVRYPSKGGYNSFANQLVENANIQFQKEVVAINLEDKLVTFGDNTIYRYEKLFSTIPLDLFINYCSAPKEIQDAAYQLMCSELLVLNFEINHPAVIKEQWLYVYDEDKISSRINFTELLSPNNAPGGKCGIQVEVYFSKYKPITEDFNHYIKIVTGELLEMGLIADKKDIIEVHPRWVQYANVIFDLNHTTALNKVLNWLETYGLVREDDDLKPMTDWSSKKANDIKFGDLILAGRFGQWKYYWTDDCVMRGKYISENV